MRACVRACVRGWVGGWVGGWVAGWVCVCVCVRGWFPDPLAPVLSCELGLKQKSEVNPINPDPNP